MSSTASASRRRLAFVALCVVVLITMYAWPGAPRFASRISSIRAPSSKLAPDSDWDGLQNLRDFWVDLALDLEVGRPTNAAPKHGPSHPDARIDGADLYSIDMSDEEVQEMSRAHRAFMQHVSELRLYDLYRQGSKGIVTTAGGKYIPIFLVSLQLLRRTGSQLPVEVFLADDSEYDATLCEKLLPSLNARCRVLSHVLNAVDQVEIKSYQFKIFAMIFSSFEDVIFLDADNLALNDPEPLLNSEPFRSTGLVLWPDFWRATVSPVFYDVQGVSQPRTAVQDSKTSETGQILVSKRLHGQTLLLAAYYNYYGPHFYYSLLSQGAPGEGDKETFSAAADFMHLPYYQVRSPVNALGFFDVEDNNSFRGTAMLQFNPTDEFDDPSARPTPSFIHANFPKFDPTTILHKGVSNWRSGKAHRMFHDIHMQGYRMAWGDDPEKAIFEEMIVVACKYGPHFSVDASKTCKEIKRHYFDLFGGLSGRVHGW